MAELGKQNGKVLIITGIAPVGLPELEEWGTAREPIVAASMSSRTSFRISVPTIGPVVIGTYLQRQGIDVEITDFYFDEVCVYDADIVGISSTFMDVKNVREIVDLISEQNPSAFIVLGGPLSWSVSPSKLLEMIPRLGCIVMREGEQTFSELIHTLRNGGDLRSVRGLVFKKEESVFETLPRPLLDEQDLGRPAWELMGLPSSARLPVLPVETGRGCPYNCVYCSEAHYWGKPVRYRTSDSVVEELRYNVESFGIKTFRFTDSCFSAPPSRSAEVCDAIYQRCIKDNVGVKWSSFGRIENLSYGLLEKMKRSGCVALDIGVESGDSSILRRMGRSYSLKAVIEVARAAREIGIITNFNVIVGLPGETKETVQRTAELIDQAAPDTFSSFVLFLAPNSRAYCRPEKYSIEGEGLSWKHATMTSEEAAEAMLWLTQEVSRSTSFPGGEHVACYLTSVGYSQDEIRDLYRAIGSLARCSTDQKALSVVTEVIKRFENFI
jgi:radical SAM superfamily enzyme YgiQ (UPF0313 family)